MSLKDSDLHLDTQDDEEDDDRDNGGEVGAPVAQMVLPVPARHPTNYFACTVTLSLLKDESIPLPHHTFSIGHKAFNLAYDPSICSISVDAAAELF